MPRTKKDQGKQAAVKEAGKTVAAAQVTAPLAVSITFPNIMEPKQAIAFDNDGNLIIVVQFKARADQYEIFRLVNLLKQPHGALNVTIGTPQSAMDFHFTKEGKVEILKAAMSSEKKKDNPEADRKALPDTAAGPTPAAAPAGLLVIVEFTTNHIPTDDRPFGCMVEFVSDGSGEVHTVAGRGTTPTEATILGILATRAIQADPGHPFEIIAALKATKETPARDRLIRAIEVGSFDINEGEAEKGK